MTDNDLILVDNRIVAVILARGGSKGIPDKNLKKLGGIPLLGHAILNAKKSKAVSTIYVSTDSEKIKQTAKQYGAQVVDRPAEFAHDTASSESALLHFAQFIDFDILVFIQCTSPLTLPSDLARAIEEFHSKEYDSLLSVTKDHGGFLCGGFTWNAAGQPLNYDHKQRPRRQELETTYRENGAFYITTRTALLSSKNRLSGKIGYYVMPYDRSFEIDTIKDLEFIRSIYPILQKHHANRQELDIGKIKMVLFDVDGCFTDGSVYLDTSGNEMLRFSRIDGKGVELLRQKGIICGVISSEDSDVVRQRMEKLEMHEIKLGIREKLSEIEPILDKYKITFDQVAFCGDDIQDIELMKRVGMSFAPQNAQDQVKRIADYISTFAGGNGFVRDVANIIVDSHL